MGKYSDAKLRPEPEVDSPRTRADDKANQKVLHDKRAGVSPGHKVQTQRLAGGSGWSRSVQIYKTVHIKMILSQARDSYIDNLLVNSIYFPSIREVGLDAKAVYGNYETVDLTWRFVDDAGHINCGMIVGKDVENSTPALTSTSSSKICPVCCSTMPYSSGSSKWPILSYPYSTILAITL